MEPFTGILLILCLMLGWHIIDTDRKIQDLFKKHGMKNGHRPLTGKQKFLCVVFSPIAYFWYLHGLGG